MASILEDFESWQKSLFGSLVKATKAVNAIPANDVLFYKSLDRSFSVNMEDAATAALNLCNGLLQQAGGVTGTEEIRDVDEMKDRFDIIVDVIDNMLEKVDVAMDEMKNPASKNLSLLSQSAPVVALAKKERLELKLIHAQNIARPQVKFADQVDNSSATPFIRKIKVKPNAKVDLNHGVFREEAGPTASNITSAMESHMRTNLGLGSELMSLPHPYEYEITHLEYPPRMFEHKSEELYAPFDSSTAKFVATEEELVEMCQDLESQQELAIDLEHHNYRSFQGFVCLMQISTRTQDYIVDTLELRSSLHLLNQAFTDPNIVKVFHGADSDIIWLQRDFGVYVVNLFDTFQASKLLEFSGHSLAHLLKLYADFDADKRYQLADWRIRPLPKEMMSYARSDTHFLLYIYDRMHNALLEKSHPTTLNLLHACLQRSSEVALKVHVKDRYDAEGGDGPGGWRNTYQKWNRAFDNQQFAVFKALHAWRDQTARDEDESVRYVLPNHMMFAMAERMPTEASGVLACCNPIPPLVKMAATDIAMLVTRTKSSVTIPARGSKPVELEVPAQVKFHPATGLQGTDAVTHDPTARKSDQTSTPFYVASTISKPSNVQTTGKSAMFGSGLSVAKLVDPASVQAKKSKMFGDFEGSVQLRPSSDNEGAIKAKRIFDELARSTPAPNAVFADFTSQQNVTVTPVNHESTDPNSDMTTGAQETTDDAPKPKRTDVLVLSSMSKKRSRAIDEERQELAESRVPSDTDSVTNTPEDMEGDETVDVKQSKDKKKKSTKSKKLADVSSESSRTEGTLPDAFQPFDYNTVRSVVEETIDSARAGKRKKQPAQQETASFDPYAKIEEKSDFKKKDATLSRAPKSGSRSMTFGGN